MPFKKQCIATLDFIEGVVSGRAEVTLQHETQKEETEHFLGADVRELIIDTYTGNSPFGHCPASCFVMPTEIILETKINFCINSSHLKSSICRRGKFLLWLILQAAFWESEENNQLRSFEHGASTNTYRKKWHVSQACTENISSDTKYIGELHKLWQKLANK